MEKISNTALENKIFSNRMMLAFIFVVFFALVLILRLFNLQITHYDYYTEEALGHYLSGGILVTKEENLGSGE